jgi:hypothetical protein
MWMVVVMEVVMAVVMVVTVGGNGDGVESRR